MKPSLKNLTLRHLLAASALLGCAALAQAAPVIGAPAPAFSLTDSQGKNHNLADFAGKTVVLEWNNPECPFVKKHYSGNIQAQQQAAAAAGVVWLTVNSSAPGKQGNLNAAQANAMLAQNKAAPAAYLFDGDGKVGQAYAAKTTPNLYVIDGTGKLRYSGAIDSIASAKTEDIPKATQYVPTALAEIAAGKAVSTPVTKPYGCSIKYADS